MNSPKKISKVIEQNNQIHDDDYLEFCLIRDAFGASELQETLSAIYNGNILSLVCSNCLIDELDARLANKKKKV